MLIVVSYDITDDKRRRKVMKTMEGYGERVQYSVFECHLQPNDVRHLKTKLARLIDHKVDDIRFYHICAECVQHIGLMGKAQLTKPVSYHYVG